MRVNAVKGQLMKGLAPQRSPTPGMPIPGSLKTALAAGTPKDAGQLEICRDAILRFFARETVNRVFVVLAWAVIFAVLAFGCIIAWAFLGLFLGLDNGWAAPKEICVDAWQTLHGNISSLPAGEVPMINGTYVADDCTLNQWWFNTCVKAFVSLFSYINFLPSTSAVSNCSAALACTHSDPQELRRPCCHSPVAAHDTRAGILLEANIRCR